LKMYTLRIVGPGPGTSRDTDKARERQAQGVEGGGLEVVGMVIHT